jgi:lipid-A-disaccharide synthase
MTAEFIGHPLFEPIANYKPKHHIADINNGRIISLFPGSRTSDIKRNLELQIASIAHLKGCKIAISVAHPSHKPPILEMSKKHGVNPILIDRKDRYEQMCKSEFALAKSGTVTLELAFFKVATIGQFRISKLEHFLLEYVFSLSLPHYVIPNILAKRRIFPEYCGSFNYLKNLKTEVDNFYTSPHLRDASKIGCEDVIKIFQNHSPSERVAEKIRSLI